METGMNTFSSDDVLRFLGRKMDGRLKGEITSDFKRRPEGRASNTACARIRSRSMTSGVCCG
jgi:hypothetical protein